MAINDISLTAGMRSNLVSLQSTVTLMNRTQERLATGKNVNTALDNPLNYFTAAALNSRAVDLAAFKDGMSEAIQTIKAANTGTSAITGLIAQAKAIAATAKAAASGGGTLEYANLDLTSVTAGQTVKIGSTTFSAVQTSLDSVRLAIASVTVGQTISIAGVTYTASAGAAGSGTGTFAFNIASDVTAVTTLAQALVADAAHVAAATSVSYSEWDLSFTAGTSATATKTITIGGVTYTASAGAAGTGAGSIGTMAFNNDTTTTAVTTLLAAMATNSAVTAHIAAGNINGTIHIVKNLADLSSTTVVTGADLAGVSFTSVLTAAVILTGGSTDNIKMSTISSEPATITKTNNVTTDPPGTRLYANEFYIGGSATNAQVATNLAAKANAASAGALSISVGTGTYTNRLIATSGTSSISTSSVISAATSMVETEISGTAARQTYATQFNDLMKQLDKVGWDSGYKGTNLLGGTSQSLEVSFGTDAADKITITGYDASSVALLATSNSQTSDYGPARSATAEGNWAANTNIDADLVKMATALDTLKSKSSSLASNLSVINVRQDWTTSMVNTLNEGSDKLTIADMNEEGANMLMLQTRQSLATTALSLSAQAAQSVLRLFA